MLSSWPECTSVHGISDDQEQCQCKEDQDSLFPSGSLQRATSHRPSGNQCIILGDCLTLDGSLIVEAAIQPARRHRWILLGNDFFPANHSISPKTRPLFYQHWFVSPAKLFHHIAASSPCCLFKPFKYHVLLLPGLVSKQQQSHMAASLIGSM